MRNFAIHLKDHFSFLGEDGRDPIVTAYLPYNMAEMKRQDWLRPCMIVCPGGGYHFCSEREAEVIGMQFLPEGYNVFVLEYSVSPHRFPVQLREIAALMELIYSNSKEWNCDTDKIAMIGFSAGGHLVCHYSNAYDWPEVREVFPESKCVNAAILSYPVISADPSFAHLGSFRHLTGHEELSVEEIAKFSCENMITEKTPPTFLWHTAEDPVVPVKNSLVYAQALAAKGIPFSLHVYPHGPHGLANVDIHSNAPERLCPETVLAAQWLPDVKAWLKTVF